MNICNNNNTKKIYTSILVRRRVVLKFVYRNQHYIDTRARAITLTLAGKKKNRYTGRTVVQLILNYVLNKYSCTNCKSIQDS